MAGRILAFVGTTILGALEQFDYLQQAKKHPLHERVKWRDKPTMETTQKSGKKLELVDGRVIQ